MTVFQRLRPRWTAAIAAAFLLPAAAFAQSGGPLRLVPQLPGMETAPSQPAFPSQGDVPNPGGGFRVETLGAVDPGALGLIREQEGGLPRSSWRGSERAQIERLMSQLQPSASPAALTLMRRLLLSEAELPEGKSATRRGFLAVRVERLTVIGDPDAGFQLASMAGNDMTAQSLAIDAAFAAGRDDDACRLAAGVPSEGRDAAWSRASAFCRALAGDSIAAGIQTGLLRERSEADPLFVTLMGSLTGLPDASPVDLKEPTSLHLAMLRAAKRIPTSASVDNLGPAGARLVSDVEGLPPDLLLRATERAFVYGGVPVENLRSAFEGVQFKPQELTAATTGKPPGDAKGRAALYQAVVSAEGEAARIKALNAAFDRLKSRDGGFDLRAGAVYLDIVASTQPAPALLDIAPRAARLLLVAGQPERAGEWLRLMEWEGRTGTVEAARAAVRLTPLFRLVDRSSTRFASHELVDWVDAWRVGSRPDSFESRAVTLLSALQGLGFDVGPDAWNKLAAAAAPSIGRRPNVAIMQAMRSAAQAGRVGETVLLALVALDGQPAASLEADALATTLDALVRVDLEAEARALALEAAIGLGL